MGVKNYDFSGWATKNNLRCSDGRTIRQNAFKDNDGQTVPLVWQHQHDNPENVLGHALLENRPDGVYAYCTFNNSESGKNAKELVHNGDINALSIYANKLKQVGTDVMHGVIREVSLVLAGANPGALIDSDSIMHSVEEADEESAIIYTGELIHMETNEKITTEENNEIQHADEKTVQDVFDTLTEEQKNVVYFLIGQALEDAGAEDVEHDDIDEEGDDFVKHNVFENETEKNENVLTHSEIAEIMSEAQNNGASLKDTFLAHSITDIDILFPDARAESNTPEFYNQPDEWVSKILNACHHSPFSRIKNLYADITMEQARALGYIKGNEKKEEVIRVFKRVTTPQTIYKKQKLDRDDIIDITDFNVVAWLKGEMQAKLKEELARAIITGDGRDPESADKIDEEHVRPIANEDNMYAEKVQIEVHIPEGATGLEAASMMVDQIMDSIILNRSKYRGSGSPSLYVPADFLPVVLLKKDGFGRRLFATKKEVEDYLNVKEIVELPFLNVGEQYVGDPEDWDTNVNFFFFLVNLNDYTIGSDKGGETNFFDDFDIDFNQYKYLYETRLSGSLRKLKSALRYQIKLVTDEGGEG